MVTAAASGGPLLWVASAAAAIFRRETTMTSSSSLPSIKPPNNKTTTASSSPSSGMRQRGRWSNPEKRRAASRLIHEENQVKLPNNNNNKPPPPYHYEAEEEEEADTVLCVISPNNQISAAATSGESESESNKKKKKKKKKKSWKHYLEETKEFILSGEGGPPRWFSPLLEHGPPRRLVHNPPLLLFLPGVDGVGLGLTRHHDSLGKIFDIWCLHIPVKDRTTFPGLVQLVEKTVRSENQLNPNKPIYLVGESLGACIALAVAARNPDIDLVLILANPATSFERSQLQALVPFLEVLQDPLQLSSPYLLSLMTGDDSWRIVMDNMVKGLTPQVKGLSQDNAMSSYVSVLGAILPRDTLLWKLQLIKSASAYTNSRIHAVTAQTLILCSGRDQFLPSQEEGRRLWHELPKCEHRTFADCGHFLFLEDRADLVTIIKATTFYRRGKYHDYISDYMPPTPSEFDELVESSRWFINATSPVMLSTLDDGKVVKGLEGVPSEGPVLFVGYHMLMGLELAPLVTRIFADRNILLRGIAHPLMFTRPKESKSLELSAYDSFRMMGAVPVSGAIFYKLLSSKAHVLLYPGGMREACHRKGEQYKLIWPERSEFVRMAARFGAKIVPFGVVGEDDFGEVVFDYDDQMKVPFLKEFNEELTQTSAKARPGMEGEVGNQGMHMPGILPKFPGGRFYFYFGKPIETEGRKLELRDREKAHEVYLQVKSEVANCIQFLREKRESDPYRNILVRLAYQATHGFDSEVPTFKL